MIKEPEHVRSRLAVGPPHAAQRSRCTNLKYVVEAILLGYSTFSVFGGSDLGGSRLGIDEEGSIYQRVSSKKS